MTKKLNVINYTVLQSGNPTGLSRLVARYKGWVPLGRAFIDHDNVFYQTMVKYEFQREDQTPETEGQKKDTLGFWG